MISIDKKKIVFIHDIDPINKRPITSEEFEDYRKDLEGIISNNDDPNNKVISTIGEISKENSIIY